MAHLALAQDPENLELSRYYTSIAKKITDKLVLKMYDVCILIHALIILDCHYSISRNKWIVIIIILGTLQSGALRSEQRRIALCSKHERGLHNVEDILTLIILNVSEFFLERIRNSKEKRNHIFSILKVLFRPTIVRV